MKLEEMKYFVEIVKARSINQASKTLFVAQPALSRMLTALEKDLGFPLLERSKHGITPTKSGQEVYNDCVRMLQQYADCRHRWNDFAYQFSDTLFPVQIVALPMICNTTMNEVFFEIAQQYPKIQLTLFECQLPNILETAVKKPHSICFSHYNEQTKDEIYAFAKEHRMQILPLFDDEYKFFVNSNNQLVGKQLTFKDFTGFTIARYSNTIPEDDSKHISTVNLADLFNDFNKTLFLSNRYTIIESVIADKAINFSADIITKAEAYRKNNSIAPLQIMDFHFPITYFLMFAAKPALEESIVTDVLQKHYRSLADPV